MLIGYLGGCEPVRELVGQQGEFMRRMGRRRRDTKILKKVYFALKIRISLIKDLNSSIRSKGHIPKLFICVYTVNMYGNNRNCWKAV